MSLTSSVIEAGNGDNQPQLALPGRLANGEKTAREDISNRPAYKGYDGIRSIAAGIATASDKARIQTEADLEEEQFLKDHLR